MVRHSTIWQWAVMGLAALSLLLVVVNGVLVVRNQAGQFQVNQRQQVVNQGLQYARVRQIIAQVVANVAVQKNDRDLTALLARHGIAINQPGASAAPEVPAPAPAAAPLRR
jgi:uncharacterized protein YpmS